MKKRDHYRYQLKTGNKIEYFGITNDSERRVGEHENDKKFSKMEIVGPAVSKDTAKKWEEEKLKTYRKNHGGKNPKYNQSDNG